MLFLNKITTKCCIVIKNVSIELHFHVWQRKKERIVCQILKVKIKTFYLEESTAPC
jgi:hypothetical protein